MAEETKTGVVVKAAAGVGGGVGIGVLLSNLVQGNPQILAQVLGWGPTVLVLGALVWLADRHAPPFIAASREQATALARLGASLEERFRQDDDVRMATRTLSGQIERLAAKIDAVIAQKETAKP